MGFWDPKLMVLALLYANIATRNSVAFGPSLRLARHMGWYLEEDAPEEEVCQAVTEEEYFEASMHGGVVSHRCL